MYLQKSSWINEQTAQKRAPAPDIAPVYPHDEALERGTLGAILVAGETGNGNAVFERVHATLRHDDFFFIRFGYVYRAMERLHQRGQNIDTISVAAELRSVETAGKTMLDLIGGETTLYGLTAHTGGNVATYAQQVAQLSLRRALIASADKQRALALRADLELDAIADQSHAILQDTLTRVHHLTETGSQSLDAAVTTYWQQLQADLTNPDFQPGVPTGFHHLDKLTLGWRKGKLYIIGGAPGMGKSAFLISSAVQALRAGLRVAFFSLEMGPAEVVERIFAHFADIEDLRHLQGRQLKDYELRRLAAAMQEIVALKTAKQFRLHCWSFPTMEKIRAKIRELQLTDGVDIVFIDYVGIEMVARANPKMDDLAHANDLWTALRVMKQELNLPIVVGSQTNRNYQHRESKTPVIADLSNSNLAEKAADYIGFLNRPVIYDALAEYPERAELLTGKNRSGPGGQMSTIYLQFTDSRATFKDWKKPGQEAEETLL